MSQGPACGRAMPRSSMATVAPWSSVHDAAALYAGLVDGIGSVAGAPVGAYGPGDPNFGSAFVTMAVPGTPDDAMTRLPALAASTLDGPSAPFTTMSFAAPALRAAMLLSNTSVAAPPEQVLPSLRPQFESP